MPNNKKMNSLLIVIFMMVGILFLIIGAGNLFIRNEGIMGVAELLVGLFLVGEASYFLITSSGNK